MRSINLIVIHCTASPNGVPRSIAEITADHKARGFSAIGYHHVINVDGTVMRGRPEDEPGAHAKGFNARSIGVCLVGGVGGKDKLNPGKYTDAQWLSLKALLTELLARYPGCKIVGHRDLSPDLDGDGEIEPREWIKLCPAFEVKSWLLAMFFPADSMRLPNGDKRDDQS